MQDMNQNPFSEMERKMGLEIESTLKVWKLVCLYLKFSYEPGAWQSFESVVVII